MIHSYVRGYKYKTLAIYCHQDDDDDIAVHAFLLYKAEEIYCFIGKCQSDSNYHEIPNEICLFICIFFLRCSMCMEKE